jgi:hypothetical protein
VPYFSLEHCFMYWCFLYPRCNAHNDVVQFLTQSRNYDTAIKDFWNYASIFLYLKLNFYTHLPGCLTLVLYSEVSITPNEISISMRRFSYELLVKHYHNQTKSNATKYRILKKVLRPKNNGSVVGIIIFVKWYVYCLKMIRLNRNMLQ